MLIQDAKYERVDPSTQPPPKPRKKYACSNCSKTFDSTQGRNAHIQKHHPEIYTTNVDIKNTTGLSNYKAKVNKYLADLGQFMKAPENAALAGSHNSSHVGG